MEYEQKIIPEGWNETKENYNLEQLQNAKLQGTIIQGFVKKCDEKCNLEVQLGENIVGIIPRNEIDAINVDDFGMTSPSICRNKVNHFVQFKVKEIYDEGKLLLSRKEAENDALNWVKNDLQEGMILNRYCKEHQKIWGVC